MKTTYSVSVIHPNGFKVKLGAFPAKHEMHALVLGIRKFFKYSAGHVILKGQEIDFATEEIASKVGAYRWEVSL